MLSSLLISVLLLLATYETCANALTLPFRPPPSDVLAGEGVEEEFIVFAATPDGNLLDRTGWTATCDSVQSSNPCQYAIDNNPSTFWYTQWSPSITPLPHQITIDMQTTYYINGITYQPRQTAVQNGNIGRHNIYVSTDGLNWGSPVAYGMWLDDQLTKTAAFEPVQARYVRVQALTEAGGRGQWTTAAEINVYAAVPGTAVDRTGWTAVCDSFQPGNECSKAITDSGGFWHSRYSPTTAPLPHNITIDMKASYSINSVVVSTRQDGGVNGNIGSFEIWTSTDGVHFVRAASGTFLDGQGDKKTAFTAVTARYVQLRALTEAGNRGPWTAVSSIQVFQPAIYTPPAKGLGAWGPTINFPIVPVAAAINPTDGRVLTWSAYSPSTYLNGPGTRTVTATWNPSTGIVSQRNVTNTGHDMFCPGISTVFSGKLLVTGGNNAQKTSYFDFANGGSWGSTANMKLQRGYQSQTTLSDGRVFTIGGSWSGPLGGKNGEVRGTDGVWTLLPGAPVAPMLTADKAGVYRSDNHAWLFSWSNGSVFQAGPSKAMNWYYTQGSGSYAPAGPRMDDVDSMCGIAVMYDAPAGKILTAGGSPNYTDDYSTSNAYVITIGAQGNSSGNATSSATVVKSGSMAYQRIFHNSVVLPDGQVFINGGQVIGKPFYDTTAQLTPEMWNPVTNSFTQLIPNSTPRVYHSVSLLLLDGTVFTGGGGLCDTCSTNHFDAQVYTPQYLLNPDGSPRSRPSITSVSATSIGLGLALTFSTSGVITSASIIRYGSSTHTVNTDQRRIPLQITIAGLNSYSVVIPSDPGIALPGYWMLFVMDNFGTPSVAKTIFIKP